MCMIRSRLFRPLLSLIVAICFLAQPAVAPTRATAQPLSQPQVSEFLGTPSKILSDNPSGGAQLVSTVRDLVLTDGATLPVIIKLLANANRAQQAAIGSGLG